ncbi:homoserine dehydrogenase [Acetobacterium woodii]|uniref:Homoserine dehydrogenase n=1 Tax=Acetobacterium woodii (strain ATCC 29683 / DSM 1030 / JCM 2381 / KCTC 1655 / WB1) TaxID=931626 RepID=H6LGF4_ACEWD|nr:homoserine dehydrogenase [Acetobacterium woodii]AFA47090.1 homoserine dehydrogenase Hom [Acetobacterium woodii DSM 1030]
MNIALLGFGTIGSGVYELINLNKGKFSGNFTDMESRKASPVITKVLERDTTKDLGDTVGKIVTHPSEILEDESIGLVIALMGGMDFEYEMIKECLKAGKHVVTANKAVISEYFEELLTLAEENGVVLRYEASVGGGIPIIGSLKEEMKINRVTEIKGILNGTTNFILSKMTEEGADFGETLALAQSIGFAEADPTADVEGYDVSRKLSILSSMAYESIIRDEDVYKRGITDVRAADIEMIGSMGYVVKYLGHSILEHKNVYTTVEPVLFKEASIMSNVNSEFNIISITGDIIGELQFYGKGAGKDATANAVVGDVLYILNIVKEQNYPKPLRLNRKLNKIGTDIFKGKYYLRANLDDKEMLDTVLTAVETVAARKTVIVNDNQVYVVTSVIAANDFNTMAEKLKETVPELFYARIYE